MNKKEFETIFKRACGLSEYEDLPSWLFQLMDELYFELKDKLK